MPTPYFYFVVTATEKIGAGDSVASALNEALTRNGGGVHYASQPRSGFHWGKYELFETNGTPLGTKRTGFNVHKVFEKCEVYYDSKKIKHIMTVYRSINIATIAKLKDQYGQSNTPKKLPRSVKAGSQREGTRSTDLGFFIER